MLTFISSNKYRVVEFEVEPMSVDHSEMKFEGDTCNFPDNPKPQIVSRKEWHLTGEMTQSEASRQQFSKLFFTLFILDKSRFEQSTVLYIFCGMERVANYVGFQMGYILEHWGRTNPLVQHCQFVGGCILFIRYSYYDYDSNIASWYCTLQHGRQLWGYIRRNWLEISSWRCISAT